MIEAIMWYYDCTKAKAYEIDAWLNRHDDGEIRQEINDSYKTFLSDN